MLRWYLNVVVTVHACRYTARPGTQCLWSFSRSACHNGYPLEQCHSVGFSARLPHATIVFGRLVCVCHILLCRCGAMVVSVWCVHRHIASIYCITRIECMWISSFTAAPKDCRSDLFVTVFIICLRSRVRSNATRHSTIVSREMNNVREMDKIGKWVCGLAGKQQSMPIALNFPIDSFQCRNYFRSNCKIYMLFSTTSIIQQSICYELFQFRYCWLFE